MLCLSSKWFPHLTLPLYGSFASLFSLLSLFFRYYLRSIVWRKRPDRHSLFALACISRVITLDEKLKKRSLSVYLPVCLPISYCLYFTSHHYGVLSLFRIVQFIQSIAHVWRRETCPNYVCVRFERFHAERIILSFLGIQ